MLRILLARRVLGAVGMTCALALLLSAGCGRVGFELLPRDDDGPNTRDDAGSMRSDASMGGSGVGGSAGTSGSAGGGSGSGGSAGSGMDGGMDGTVADAGDANTCESTDTDTDGDETPDCADGCPDDPDKLMPEDCGCGETETDTDLDGDPDCIDVCNGVDDASYVPDSSCGLGHCLATNTASTCVAGTETACMPGTQLSVDDTTCDGVDDDCDGYTDENYVSTPTSCGIGACAAVGTLSCESGSPSDSCTVGTPAANDATCNGVDEDCSGANDEDYVSTPTNCGVGACAAAGTLSCVSGSPSDSCTAGTPAANDANCNGVDEDCSGANDEDYVSTPTNCGVGACAASGTLTCVSGSPSNSCVAGTPAASDATCNGVDEDCSGANDEDYVSTPTNCGVGACARSGTLSCVSGSPSNSCNPGTPAANDATCNGIDEDCSGTADEDYLTTTTNCGVGACVRSGMLTCVSGSPNNSCMPGAPGANDATCNGVDEDCSGANDEDYVSTPTNCGVGACARSGTLSCVSGSPSNSCMPGTPAANDATCNGVDEDCSGANDEDYSAPTTNCGLGVCARTGLLLCSGGSTNNTCVAGPPNSAIDDVGYPGNGLNDDCDMFTDEDSIPCDTAPRTFGPGTHNSITVPVNCTTVTVRLWGAAGGTGGITNSGTGGRGGAGGYATTSSISITGALQLYIGNGGTGCGAGGTNAGSPATYNGGAGGGENANGTAGNDLIVAGGGTGAVGPTGGDGARGYYGGGGGGGGDREDWWDPAGAPGSGGGAASVFFVNSVRTVVAGGGGGGGGEGGDNGNSWFGGAGGQGCGGNGGVGTAGRPSGGGGGGGVCVGGTTTQGVNGVPANSGSIPAGQAASTTGACSSGGGGYAIITFAP